MDESLTPESTEEPCGRLFREVIERNVHAPQVLWVRNSEEHTRRKYGQKEIHDQRAGSAEPTVSVIFYPYETLGSL